MQRLSSLGWCGALLSLCLGIPGALPANARSQRSVSDWISLGNAQLARGRPGAALTILGEVAAQYPGLAPARDGLRNWFARFGSTRRSEAFLRYALTEDPAHRRAFLAAWQILDQTHPLRFSISASILPSSNIEHVASERYLVTKSGTFLIKEGGKETPGVGVGIATSLDWVLHPSPGHRFRLRAGYAGAWFDRPALRYGERSLALRYEYLGGRIPWSLEWFARQRRYGGSARDVTSDNITRGLTFLGRWSPAPGRSVLLQLGGAYGDYSRQSYFTGPRYDLDLEIRSRPGGQGSLSYGLHLERGLPRTGYHRYVAARLRIGYEHPLSRGLRAGISLAVASRRYDAPFPIVGKRRRDRTLSLGLSAELGRVRIFGQVPTARCTLQRTRSNIALYSSKAVDCAMALKFAF